jgi:hypothetical protein
MMPIFPVEMESSSKNYSPPLDELFKLDKNQDPDNQFLDALIIGNLWWSNYVLLDKSGAAEVIDFFGGVNIGTSRVIDGKDALLLIPDYRKNPTAALIGQAKISQSLCQHMARKSQDVNIAELSKLVSIHVKTDMTSLEILNEWRTMSVNGGGISCVYPSLIESLPQIVPN